MLKLYYAPGACSFASHIALEESGLPYETQKLNLQEGDQNGPEVPDTPAPPAPPPR